MEFNEKTGQTMLLRHRPWPDQHADQTTDTFYVLIFLLSQSFSAPFDFNACLSLPLISPIITLEQPQVAFLLHLTMTPHPARPMVMVLTKISREERDQGKGSCL